jgi:hydrogenase maturation protease
VTERGTGGETILIIGYGNELRGDDGLGPRVAEAIAAANYPAVHVRSVFQLVPELAAEVAEARMVVFVDALAAPGRVAVELTPVGAEENTDWSTHTADPRTLLALTRAVYGRTPEAWWLKAPGWSFDFGEGLSSAAEVNMRQAIARIKKLIQAKTRDRLPVGEKTCTNGA